MSRIEFYPRAILPLRKDRKIRKVFCDESCQTDNRYFVLGALYYDSDHEEIEALLESVKLKHALKGEVKWDKVPRKPGQYFDGYIALVDKFMELPITFKAIIIDTRRYPIDHNLHAFGDHELGYYKFYYQLLYNGIISLDPQRNYMVRLDYHPNSDDQRIVDLTTCIEARASRDEFPDIIDGSCCSIEETDSKLVHSLQLADLLTGVVAARWNGKVKNQTKLKFIEYLEKRLGIDVGRASQWSEKKFKRWVFEAKK